MPTQRELVRGQAGRPLLIYVGGWVLVLLSIPELLFIGLMVVEAVLDPTGATFGALGVNDLSATQLLATSPVLLLVAGAQAVLGYGLLKKRSWARPLGTSLWLGIGVLTGGAQALAGLGADRFHWSLMWGLLCTSAAFWYFYRKPNVRAYYERAERAVV
ncbi:MAG: hypothetical protein LC667_12320 [Thioalkalivibrio sp.]|nr:hypothetical protein [Thioalkalivibrio sp.]